MTVCRSLRVGGAKRRLPGDRPGLGRAARAGLHDRSRNLIPALGAQGEGREGLPGCWCSTKPRDPGGSGARLPRHRVLAFRPRHSGRSRHVAVARARHCTIARVRASSVKGAPRRFRGERVRSPSKSRLAEARKAPLAPRAPRLSSGWVEASAGGCRELAKVSPEALGLGPCRGAPAAHGAQGPI
jgi:hypothetical protein